MDQLHLPHSFTALWPPTQYSALLPILLFLLWSRTPSPSLSLLKLHTAPALKPRYSPLSYTSTFPWDLTWTHACYFDATDQGLGPCLHCPSVSFSTACSKKLPLHSSTAHPIWLSPPSCILSWKCRSIPSTIFWRTAEHHTAEQLETDTTSWSETPVKREPPARCLAHSWNQSL